MTAKATLPPHVIGCDVGKQEIVAFDTHSGELQTLKNQPEILRRFVARLPKQALLVCEATGGYEAALLQAAVSAGLPAHRADARKVKSFIRSLGKLAKSDAIDARGLARYGCERFERLARWTPPPAALKDLQSLVRLRAQCVKQRAALKVQRTAPGGQAIQAHLHSMIDHADQAIAALEDDIAALLASQPERAAAAKVIQAIPGCGSVTAVTLVALMPELGQLQRKEAASLAGLAPHPNQSASRDGYRRTRGGRPEIKRALFTAALAARRYNPQLKAVFLRLINNGKKPIVAITAIMRKLIVIINAKLRDAYAHAPQN